MFPKKNIKIAVSFLIVALLFYFLFRNIDTELFLKYLSLGSRALIAAGVTVYLLAFFVRAARWKVLLRHIGKFKVAELAPVIVAGYAVNNVLPVRIGEIVRAAIAGKIFRISIPSAFASVFVERIFDGLTIALILSMSAAFAEPTVVDGLAKRNIKINEAGLNPSADEMIAQMISPTTGRNLDAIDYPDGFVGTAVTGIYQPILVQISNAGGSVNTDSKGRPTTAPVNANYADVVYEACQANSANGGSLTRFSMLFSDTVPDYVGFVRSTRATHPRIRQEWDCAFVTSGYSSADVPKEWQRFNVMSPQKATPENPGLVYVQNFPKVWAKYMFHCTNIFDANDHVYQLANIVQNVIPKDHVPANHTFKFTDEVPAGGVSGEIVYVSFGGGTKTDSRLEYDEENNEYIRYIPIDGKDDFAYRTQTLVNPKLTAKNVNGAKLTMVDPDDRVYGDLITFTNVIVQGIKMNWFGSERPDPELTGKGNADYFIGGKHYTGVWERKDYNSRTVFYGEDGNEIELMRGKTLIILMDYNSKGRSVKYE